MGGDRRSDGAGAAVLIPLAPIDPNNDYSSEPTTLVEFRLEPDGEGTVVHLIETGFESIPLGRRFEAFRMNERGWGIQMTNIAQHVDQPA
jgi:hypothetical protein